MHARLLHSLVDLRLASARAPRALLTALGVLSILTGLIAISSTASTTGALATGVLIIAILAITALLHQPSTTAQHALARPRATIDVSVRLGETDLDAPGHTRPRAPGSAASAA